MKKFQRILFAGSFASFCAVLLYGGWLLCFPYGVFRPILDSDVNIRDLGTVQGDDRIDCLFTLRNDGNRPLLFESVQPGCGSGNDIEISSFSLAPLLPGEQRELTVTFRPRLLQGPVLKKVVVNSNDPRSPRFVLSLQADVRAVLNSLSSEMPTLAPPIE